MRMLCYLRYPFGRASSRVRGFHLADELDKHGIPCSIIVRRNLISILRLLPAMSRHEAVILQKTYTGIDLCLHRLARAAGKCTVFDLDDAPFGNTYLSRAEKLAVRMMRGSSMVFAGSHALEAYAQRYNERTYLIPSSINGTIYRPQPTGAGRRLGGGDTVKGERRPVTLGWIGDGTSYRRDLQLLTGPLRRLGRTYELRLRIIGARGERRIRESFADLGLIDVRVIDEIEWTAPSAVPSEIARFDIGLYPLLNSEFNRFKCGYKALEYMSMGVPVVASPVGENAYIVENGTDGFLAADEEQWYRKLSILVRNEPLRRSMGEAGRGKVEREYSLAVTAEKVARILQGCGRGDGR